MVYNWGYSPFTKCLLTFWDILVKPFFSSFCYEGYHWMLSWWRFGGRRPQRKKRVVSLYSDLTRPHPKWWFTKGNLLFQGNLPWWNITIWLDSIIIAIGTGIFTYMNGWFLCCFPWCFSYMVNIPDVNPMKFVSQWFIHDVCDKTSDLFHCVELGMCWRHVQKTTDFLEKNTQQLEIPRNLHTLANLW